MRQILTTQSSSRPTIRMMPPRDFLSGSSLPGGYAWAFWLRASDIAQADGSAVQTWVDNGSGGTNATNVGTGTTLATNQQNGKAAVRFPGSPNVMSSNRTASQKPLTVVTVIRVLSLSGTSRSWVTQTPVVDSCG